MDSHYRQLADCLCGILFPGAGQPFWPRPILSRPVKDHPGGDYHGGLLRLFHPLSQRGIQMELPGWFPDDNRRGFCHIQEVVSIR